MSYAGQCWHEYGEPILVPLDATKIQWELMRGDLRNAYEQWTVAKANKEWPRANALRDELRAEGKQSTMSQTVT